MKLGRGFVGMTSTHGILDSSCITKRMSWKLRRGTAYALVASMNIVGIVLIVIAALMMRTAKAIHQNEQT